MTSPTTRFYRDATVAALACAGLSFAAWFAFGLVLTAHEKVMDIKRNIATLSAKQGKATGILNEYERAQEDIARATSVLLDRNDKLTFIIMVERLAAEYGVTHIIQAVEGDAQDATGKKDHITFSLGVSGSFAQVLKFTQALEYTEYYAAANSVHMFTASGKGGSAVGTTDEVRAQLSLRVYVR
ncbi:MAG: hypothetical protein AAB581_01690 [Patescibacteria group bacterium]